MGGVDGKPLPTDVTRESAQHPSAEKNVDVERDEERGPNAGDPERNANKAGANASAQNRGRTWTLAHQKALLRTVLDEECCLFEKVSNVEKNSAWKLLLERLRGSYPDLFGGWILQRKVVQRRLMDIIRLHRDNEQEALRATGRGGGRVDEELAQLCEEVSERMEEAEARKGAEASQKNLAREEKERLGELLREHQLQRGGKRKQSTSPTSTSPDEAAGRAGGRRRRSSATTEREGRITCFREELKVMRRERAYDRAVREYDVQSRLFCKNPVHFPEPLPLEEYIARHLEGHSTITTSLTCARSTQVEEVEVEVESPNKERSGKDYS
eukprot:jgi/Pico_ML_1/50917/g2035.t1